jgi:hypothetical protein
MTIGERLGELSRVVEDLSRVWGVATRCLILRETVADLSAAVARSTVELRGLAKRLEQEVRYDKGY